MMYFGGFGWLWMLLSGLFYVGLFILLIFLIIRLVHWSRRSWPSAGEEYQSPQSGSKALDILAERYARGEIDDEEYKKKKEELSKK